MPCATATELVAATEFEIEPITYAQTSEQDRKAIMKFVEKAQGLSKSVSGATSIAGQAKEQLDAIKKVVRGSKTLDPAMEKEVRELELKLMDIMEL